MDSEISVLPKWQETPTYFLAERVGRVSATILGLFHTVDAAKTAVEEATAAPKRQFEEWDADGHHVFLVSELWVNGRPQVPLWKWVAPGGKRYDGYPAAYHWEPV